MLYRISFECNLIQSAVRPQNGVKDIGRKRRHLPRVSFREFADDFFIRPESAQKQTCSAFKELSNGVFTFLKKFKIAGVGRVISPATGAFDLKNSDQWEITRMMFRFEKEINWKVCWGMRPHTVQWGNAGPLQINDHNAHRMNEWTHLDG